jgi:hypothetical protein
VTPVSGRVVVPVFGLASTPVLGRWVVQSQGTPPAAITGRYVHGHTIGEVTTSGCGVATRL